MIRLHRLTSCVVVLALAAPVRTHVTAQAQTQAPPPTLQQLTPAKPEQPASRVDQARNPNAKTAADRNTHCLRAFGHAAFCSCLGEQLPPDVSFLTYIQIVASTKDELGYARLSAGDKKLADLVAAARDGCVAKAFAGGQ